MEKSKQLKNNKAKQNLTVRAVIGGEGDPPDRQVGLLCRPRAWAVTGELDHVDPGHVEPGARIGTQAEVLSSTGAQYDDWRKAA